MKELIIETFSWTPHIETAYEIALNKKKNGSDVFFCFLEMDNPEQEPPNLNLLGKIKHHINERKKFKKIYKSLRNADVSILSKPQLAADALLKINQFVSGAPSDIQELFQYKYDNYILGMAVASSLISYTKNPYPDLQKYQQLYNRLLKTAALVFEYASQIYEELKPDRITSFNGRFAGSKGLFLAAEKLNIKIQYHERGATFDKYEIFDKPPHDFEYIRSEISKYWNKKLPGLSREEIGHDFFKRRREGDGIGWISFTNKQQKGKALEISDKKKIVYFSSSDDEFAAIGDIVTHPVFENQRQAILYLKAWMTKEEGYELVIRIHPHLNHKSAEEKSWWENLQSKNVTVVPANSDVDSYSLIDWADTVITYGSTVGIEATYWGKPSILIGDSTYSALDCVYTMESVDELDLYLQMTDLDSKPQENCLPFGYYYLNFGKTYNHYSPVSLFEGNLLNS